MKDTSENHPTSRQSARPETTTNLRPEGTSYSSRHSQTRPITTDVEETPSAESQRPGVRLTSLSALYQPAFKPYSFTHMYDTKYNSDFKGRYWPPPMPNRVSSANYAPINYRFGSTTYQRHFQQRKPFPTAFVIPYSRHNNPQPNMVNSYNCPDGVKWIWNPSTGTIGNANGGETQGKNRLRNHRWYSR